jgi:hypothetical protein
MVMGWNERSGRVGGREQGVADDVTTTAPIPSVVCTASIEHITNLMDSFVMEIDMVQGFYMDMGGGNKTKRVRAKGMDESPSSGGCLAVLDTDVDDLGLVASGGRVRGQSVIAQDGRKQKAQAF